MTSGNLIAITGVTGSQGGAAARHVIRNGWRVRGLTRDATSARAQRAASNGVELVNGDMSDAAALDRLFDGAYGAYVVTDFFRNGLQKEAQQGCAAADAAARAGVSHFVFPSLALSERNTGVPCRRDRRECLRRSRRVHRPRRHARWRLPVVQRGACDLQARDRRDPARDSGAALVLPARGTRRRRPDVPGGSERTRSTETWSLLARCTHVPWTWKAG